MYCINCGVKLADTEKKCPLCNTLVFHPYIEQPAVRPLFPEGRMPKTNLYISAKSSNTNTQIQLLSTKKMEDCQMLEMQEPL